MSYVIAREREAKMRLLRIFLSPNGACGKVRFHIRCQLFRRAFVTGEITGNLTEQFVGYVACHRNDRLLRRVACFNIAVYILPCDLIQHILRAKNAVAKRMRFVACLGDEIVHQIIRCIVIHTDFLNDDIFLFLQFLLIKYRIEVHIR